MLKEICGKIAFWVFLLLIPITLVVAPILSVFALHGLLIYLMVSAIVLLIGTISLSIAILIRTSDDKYSEGMYYE